MNTFEYIKSGKFQDDLDFIFKYFGIKVNYGSIHMEEYNNWLVVEDTDGISCITFHGSDLINVCKGEDSHNYYMSSSGVYHLDYIETDPYLYPKVISDALRYLEDNKLCIVANE